MERSSKFMSINGLSGVLIGCFALIGAAAGYYTVYGTKSEFGYRDHYVLEEQVLWKLVAIALLVLIVSIVTGVTMGATGVATAAARGAAAVVVVVVFGGRVGSGGGRGLTT